MGIYGLTFKENVDDTRESPALQLIAAQARRGGAPFVSYDPFVNKELVTGQFFDFDEFIYSVDLLVILVKHSHILAHRNDIADMTVLDCQNVLDGDNVSHL